MEWLKRIARKVFGRPDHQAVADARRLATRVDALGAELRAESDAALRARVDALRSRLEPVETFAVVREAAARTLGMRPYDVQVQCAALLHEGCVVEMKTGEGKTLAATLPAALHAFAGRGVHVVTVNDYLAARDAELMGPLYRFLGLSVAAVTDALEPGSPERRAAYAADITYLANDGLVFDYLRDNLALSPEQRVLRPLEFALVDEADLVLLDEARTPLIISEPGEAEVDLVEVARAAVTHLSEGIDYAVDRRMRAVAPTERGWTKMEAAVGVAELAHADNVRWVHALRNALKAEAVYERDVDYMVDDDRIVLIDEYTGRITPDRRLADGLHQALEAKEGVFIRAEDATVARTTYQSYFRLYPKLAGMTGTAVSARPEFGRIYGLVTAPVPTHRPMIRRDLAPAVYRSGAEKHRAVADEVERLRAAGRPVLVGTTSVRESETLAALLRERALPHVVLNARNHVAEAAIIAQAGRPGAVTLSTSMAGRGVDILLGGNPDGLHAAHGGDLEEWKRRCAADHEEVVAAGGLAIVGTGLHESRRIDDQLRGRAGRQGDPGSSRYFLSLDDPVYRIYGDRIEGFSALEHLRERLADHPLDAPVTDPEVLDTLKGLRKKVEVENETIRKEVAQYDLVVAQQREVVYGRRRPLVDADDLTAREVLGEALDALFDDLLERHFEPGAVEDAEGAARLRHELGHRFGLEVELAAKPAVAARSAVEAVDARLSALEAEVGEPLGEVVRQTALDVVDVFWKEHLTRLERLEDEVALRGYAGLEPLIEFRREATELFGEMMAEARLALLATVCSFDVVDVEEADPLGAAVRRDEKRRTRKR